MKTKFEYTLVGDIYLPNLISTEINYEIGFWGQQHKKYLKENHRVIYYNLLTSGKLYSYLHKIDVRAKKMYENLMRQLVEQEGITDHFKAKDMMAWVQAMNNTSNRVREIVNADLIYA